MSKQSATESANEAHFDKVVQSFGVYHEAFEYAGSGISGALFDSTSRAGVDIPNAVALDYACGNGYVALKLAARCARVVGVDVSQKSIDDMLAKAEQAGMSDRVQAVKISANDLSNVPALPVDVAVCSHAFHHFDDPESVTKVLAAALKPGGVLIVMDFLTLDEEHKIGSQQSHEHEHGHAHANANDLHKDIQSMVPHQHGFSIQRMHEIMDQHFASVQVDDEFYLSKAKMRSFEGTAKMFGKMIEDNGDDRLRYVRAVGVKKA